MVQGSFFVSYLSAKLLIQESKLGDAFLVIQRRTLGSVFYKAIFFFTTFGSVSKSLNRVFFPATFTVPSAYSLEAVDVSCIKHTPGVGIIPETTSIALINP